MPAFNVMSVFYRTCLLAAMFCFGAQAANASVIPNGSYRYTCHSVTVSGDKLQASCKNLQGRYKHTVLTHLNACLNDITKDGDIGNIDGNLVCLPDLPKPVPRMVFPVSETTINSWIYHNYEKDMYRHSWDIWAGLTHQVGVVDGVPVRAFETWATTSNMKYRTQSGQLMLESVRRKTPESLPALKLSVPLQFRNMRQQHKAKLLSMEEIKASNVGDTNILVSVAFNPPSAKHAISNKLFLQSTLDTYLKEGYTEIPNFPTNAINIKPVYKIIPKDTPNGIYTFPAWPGPPQPVKAFPEQAWNSCVYVDIKGSGKGGNSVDKGCHNRNASNTFFLNNFIHQKLSQADANYLNAQFGLGAKAGDIAILVAMHVTTREIKRWTWQTYWWSANPSNPYAPSSERIALVRPLKYMDSAAQHYAMAVAYSMIKPAQPIMGGKSIGNSLYTYNPYLEAGFSPSAFQVHGSITKSDGSGVINNQYGVETNCMTCHGLANYEPQGFNPKAPDNYGTDFYMSLSDPYYDNSLKLDFAWSLYDEMIHNVAKK